jgi:hypothetical protein
MSLPQRSVITESAVVVINAQNCFAGNVIGHHLISLSHGRRCARQKLLKSDHVSDRCCAVLAFGLAGGLIDLRLGRTISVRR